MTTRPSEAPFDDAVPGVFLMCAKEKVRRVHASTIVACVTNQLAGRQFAKSDLIGNAMGKVRAVFDGEIAVSVCADVACPFPTLIGPGALDLCPEAFFNHAEIIAPTGERGKH